MDSLGGKNEPPSKNGFSVDPLTLGGDSTKESIINNSEGTRDKVLSSDETLKFAAANSSSSMETKHDPNFPAISQGADSVKSIVDKKYDNIKMQVPSDLNVRCLDESYNDFSSTFMLDEELELEQRTGRNDHPSTVER